MQVSKAEIEKQLAVLEILSKEIPFKYPKGSAIVFSQNSYDSENEGFTKFSCGWYDKIGKGFPLQNIISRPPEWQNLTEEEAEKICKMFDDPIMIKITRGPIVNPNYTTLP